MALNNILEINSNNIYSNSLTMNPVTPQPVPGANTLWLNAADNDELYLGNVPVSGNAGTVTSITAGTGLSASPANPIVSSGTISMAALSPDPSGTIAMPQVTVNAYGQVTNAVVGTKMSYNGAGNGSGGHLTINNGIPVTLAPYNETPDLAIDASIFNPTTGIFTAPVTGVYMLYFVCPLLINEKNSVVTFNALIQGSPFPMLAFRSSNNDSDNYVCNGSYCTRLFANETLAIQVAISNAGGVVPDTSYFNMTVIQIA